MITCGDYCVMCCDFCIHVIHETYINDEDEEILSGPAGCALHTDQRHQDIAEACGYCDDFHCFLAEDKSHDTN